MAGGSRTVKLPSGRTATLSGGGGDEEFEKRFVDKLQNGGLTSPTGLSLLHMAAGAMTASHCVMFHKMMGCDINGTDEDGRTPLFLAVGERNQETMLYLVENGADVNWSENSGGRPLHLAANRGTKEIVELLASKGADINGTDKNGRTPLFLAIFGRNYETALFLIENGADVNWSAANGERPLHFAANKGSKEIAELLISKGADMHANSPRGTPMHYAAVSGSYEVLEYLLELKGDPNSTNSSVDASPFFKALMSENISIQCLELLVKAGADLNRASYLVTPLEYASTRCDEEVIIFLLQSGADPDMADMMGLKPIEHAALKGRREVVDLLFPLTSRIKCYPDWSVSGVMQHVKSREEKAKSKSKLKEINLLAKAKGEEALENKNYFDAAAWYKKALEADPSDAKVLSDRSLCFTMINNGTKALKNAKACIALNPDWAMAHYREGEAWKVLKKYEKAANAFSKALALEPHNELINEELRAVRAEAAELEEGSH